MLPRRLIPFLILLLVVRVSPVMACLNDTDVGSTENEFRSRYDQAAAKDAAPSYFLPSTWAISPLGLIGGTVGVGLAGWATIASMRRQKRGGGQN
jgi:hypothetical protein